MIGKKTGILLGVEISTQKSETPLEGPPITLEHFTGPLDLLLHLIKKEEVSIYAIPIVHICDQYHEHLKAMADLDLEVAGEFLWMASWLLQLKSRMLLPVERNSKIDPRDELVERLLEYRRVKELASLLYSSEVLRRFQWPAEMLTPEIDQEAEIDIDDIDLVALARTYLEVMDRHSAAHPPPLEIMPLRYKVEDKMRDLYSRVRLEGTMPLLRHLLRKSDPEEVVALFVAALELTRLGGVYAEQLRPFAEIYLRSTGKIIDPESFFTGEKIGT